MNEIPALLLLILGVSAAFLFIGVFIGATFITMRNRRIIHDISSAPMADKDRNSEQ